MAVLTPQLFHAKKLKRALLVLIVAWLAASGAATWQLVHRSGPRFPEPPPSNKWQALRLQTTDGQQIGAWLTTGNPKHPIVLLLHGNGGSRSDTLDLAQALDEQGYGVLTLSLRAHGDSTGELNDMGYSARYDVLAGVHELLPLGRPILVLGRSLGSSAALYAAGELGTQVQGYFLESPFYSLETAVHNRLRRRLPGLIEPAAFAGLDLWAHILLPAEIVPGERASDIPRTVPLTIVTGGLDYRATVQDAEAIKKRAPQARIVVFPAADHLQSFTSDRPLYLKELQSVLQKF